MKSRRFWQALTKDTATSYEEGLLELYKKIRPGEPLAVDSAEKPDHKHVL